MSNLQVYNIATLNVKTQYKNFKEKNIFQGQKNVKIVADWIRENKINFLGTQELTKPHQETLAKELGDDYTVYGEYRFGNHLAHYIPGVRAFNESNAIITNCQIDQKSTHHLPSCPTRKDIVQTGPIAITKLQPRIRTYVSSEEEKIIHINTHLHDSFPEKREQQEQCLFEYLCYTLSVLQDVIKNHLYLPSSEIIVTGDFNDDITKPSFQKFVEQMKTFGFERVPVMQRTYSKQRENVAIDHIFISKGLSLEDYKVCDTGDITTTTDHYPVIAKVKKK